MASIHIIGASATTLTNLQNVLVALGHTVTTASSVNTSTDYTAYNLVFLVHYDASQMSNYKTKIIDAKVPVVFSSQANKSGTISLAADSLAIYLGIATTESTINGTTTYVTNDVDSVFSSKTLPWNVGSGSSYSSYLRGLSANVRKIGQAVTGESFDVSVALLPSGIKNTVGTAFGCNVAFVGSIGLNWSSSSAWSDFLNLFIPYLISTSALTEITGNVKDFSQNLIERKVAIYNRNTMQLRETKTSSAGVFSFKVPKGNYFAVCLDDESGTKESLIRDKLIIA